MRILALLPDDSLRALQRAMGTDDAIARVGDAASLLHGAKSANPDAIVVDPAAMEEADWMSARALLEAPGSGVLIYSNLRTESVKRVVEASGIGVHEVLLRFIDDDPEAIRRRLETLRRPTPPARVLASIASRVAMLPPPLQSATMPLFCAGVVPRWADEIAAASGVPRRSLDRHMERAGLAGTATVLDVARLARVWVPLVEQKQDAADVAVRAGLRRSRMLAVHTRRLVGAPPSQFGEKLTEDEFVRRLSKYIRRS